MCLCCKLCLFLACIIKVGYCRTCMVDTAFPVDEVSVWILIQALCKAFVTAVLNMSFV